MPRPPVSIHPVGDRVMIVVEPCQLRRFYELDLSRAEWLLSDLRLAVEAARAVASA